MTVELIESVITNKVDIELCIDNYTITFYESLADLVSSLDMDIEAFPDSTIHDLFVLTVTNKNKKQRNYSIAIDRRRIEEHIDNLITTLEESEEYEVCNAYFKLKNKYKSLTHEE